MNKLIISHLVLLLFVVGIGCKKKKEDEKEVATASWPTITTNTSTEGITKFGTIFSTINVGASIENVTATAYDSVLNENCIVEVISNTVNVAIPGLGYAIFKAKNSNGYITNGTVYVGVTSIDESWNLAGIYKRTANGALVNVTKLARGLYVLDNVAGAPTFPVVGYFVQVNDSILDFPLQPTENVGDIDCLNEKLMVTSSDTSYSWIVNSEFFGNAVRTFSRQ